MSENQRELQGSGPLTSKTRKNGTNFVVSTVTIASSAKPSEHMPR